jgi:voltage-gated potassium channel
VDYSADVRRRLVIPVTALLAIVLVGAVGYYQLGGGRWSFGDCLYMTVITLTTVGFGEVLEDMDAVRGARAFTTVLIVVGLGVFLYLASRVTATIIEGELRRALRGKRMLKRIENLENHVVVCGAGSTGGRVVEELVAAERPCVAIDSDPELLERHAAQWGERYFCWVTGDATDDAVLATANLARASAVVAALPNDKDNLYLVVTARQANPEARIVARGSTLEMLDKLKKAGSNAVVSPNYIGGIAMVSELIRPHVITFVDAMLRDRVGKWRIEEVAIPVGAKLFGRTLRDADLHGQFEIVVLAARTGDGSYIYSPGPDYTIASDVTLLVLGRMDRVDDLRKQLRG